MIRRVLDRFAAKAAATNAPVWAYDKLEVMEELDSNARVKERTEKDYRTQMVQGIPDSRLVRMGGRELTEAQIKKETEREAAFQIDLGGHDSKKAGTKHEAFNPEDVIARFEWNALRRESVHGRQTVVVSFQRRPGKDNGSIEDRLLNRLAGMFWVDEATGEVARLEAHLTKGLSIGVWGLLGAIKDCRIELVSTPMTDGTWLPEKMRVSASARMFLSNVRFQMEQTSSNFTLEPAPKSARR